MVRNYIISKEEAGYVTYSAYYSSHAGLSYE